MDPLEQEEEEAKKEGRRGEKRKKTEEEKEEDVEEEEAGISAELDQYRAQVMELPITSRESKLEELLRKLMKFELSLNDQLRQSERPSKDVLAAVEKEVQEDLKKVKVLIGAGAGKCFTDLPQMTDFNGFVKDYLCSRNGKVRNICQDILKTLINEVTADDIFDLICVFLNGPSLPHASYLACCNVLNLCNDKGACPTTDKIEALLTSKTFSTREVLLAFLQLMEQLIKTHRNHGNSDPIKIHLNPMQDLYEVSEDLRSAAGRVIRAAYGTLSNCLESKSLINTLLFLDSGVNNGDDALIKGWFEKPYFPLQSDMKTPVFKSAMNQILHDPFQPTSEIEKHLSLRNDNWFHRSLLHLVAIFMHNDSVRNLIPKKFIEEEKDGRDLHGCAPLHMAYLHDNQSVISLLKSDAVMDHFERSFEVPYEYNEDDYTECCQKIATTKLSVYDTMKTVLVLPVKECEAIEANFKMLFEKMVSQAGLLNATVKIAGSVREKLKVGRFNEVDVQIRMKTNPFDLHLLPSFSLHENLVKSMNKIDWSQIYLRPVSAVSIDTPWKFIWERRGSFNGLMISVDVVPIIIGGKDEGLTKEQRENLDSVVKKAPNHESLEVLKSNKFLSLSSRHTICEHEWDILDSLHPGCRLGILIAKALLEVIIPNYLFIISLYASYIGLH